MSLFPKCDFSIELPNGPMAGGRRVDGILELTAPEPIPRAEHIDLSFLCRAWAGYGGGKSRTVIERDIFSTLLRVDLPLGVPLPAGTHRYPFAFDLPPWVLPSFAGDDCGITNTIEMRLDVDWAKDPVRKIVPFVTFPPGEGVLTQLVTRSPDGFHKSIVLEVTLDSSVIAKGQAFSGRVALRGGHGARFDAIELTLRSVARIVMYRGDARSSPASWKVRIPAEALRRGESVPFVVTPFDATPSTFRSSFLDHAILLDVVVDVPWAKDPSFTIPVLVFPAGSFLHPNPDAQQRSAVVGSERLQLLASYMAQASGLRPGRLPTLVEGHVGPVAVRVADSPRAGRLGLDVELVFPDLELGIAFRRLGLLDGRSPLVPEALGGKYVVHFTPTDARPRPADRLLAGLSHAVLDGLDDVEELQFSDHHLGYHVPLTSDGSEHLQAIARVACAKARTIGAALAALPFPVAAQVAATAWLATAAEQSATLVPSGPSLHGLAFRSRILGGEERALVASLRTAWRDDGPATLVDLDLRATPLTPAALDAITNATDGGSLSGVRAVFPIVHATGVEHAVLERAGLAADPRSLFVGIEAFAAWLLDARGERRADAPYR